MRRKLGKAQGRCYGEALAAVVASAAREGFEGRMKTKEVVLDGDADLGWESVYEAGYSARA